MRSRKHTANGHFYITQVLIFFPAHRETTITVPHIRTELTSLTLAAVCFRLFLLCLDRHSGASSEVQKEEEKKFKEVGEAFSVLSDPKKKTRYDSGQDLEDDGMNMGGQHLDGPTGFKRDENVFSRSSASFLC